MRKIVILCLLAAVSSLTACDRTETVQYDGTMVSNVLPDGYAEMQYETLNSGPCYAAPGQRMTVIAAEDEFVLIEIQGQGEVVEHVVRHPCPAGTRFVIKGRSWEIDCENIDQARRRATFEDRWRNAP